jgi:hypothetical protein
VVAVFLLFVQAMWEFVVDKVALGHVCLMVLRVFIQRLSTIARSVLIFHLPTIHALQFLQFTASLNKIQYSLYHRSTLYYHRLVSSDFYFTTQALEPHFSLENGFHSVLTYSHAGAPVRCTVVYLYCTTLKF